MRTLTAILHCGESDEGGFWATCLEVPGANGQGETREECLDDLAGAVKLLLEVNEEEHKKRLTIDRVVNPINPNPWLTN